MLRLLRNIDPDRGVAVEMIIRAYPGCLQGQIRQGGDFTVPRAVLPEQPDVLHWLERTRDVETADKLQAVVRAEGERGERVGQLLSDHVPHNADG